MKLQISTSSPGYEEANKRQFERMRKAAVAALREVADNAVADARSNIAGAGFSARRQKEMRSRFFENRPSLNAAAVVFHRRGFMSVFEYGATISGKPLLWLPLSGAPIPRRRGRPLTPRQYAKAGRTLVFVERGGKPPLLVGRQKRTAEGQPLYVGINIVTIRKRLRIMDIIAGWARRIGEIYARRMNQD